MPEPHSAAQCSLQLDQGDTYGNCEKSGTQEGCRPQEGRCEEGSRQEGRRQEGCRQEARCQEGRSEEGRCPQEGCCSEEGRCAQEGRSEEGCPQEGCSQARREAGRQEGCCEEACRQAHAEPSGCVALPDRQQALMQGGTLSNQGALSDEPGFGRAFFFAAFSLRRQEPGVDAHERNQPLALPAHRGVRQRQT